MRSRDTFLDENEGKMLDIGGNIGSGLFIEL